MGGVFQSIDQLKSNGVDAAVVGSLKDGFFLSDFGVRNVEIVGPTVGAQLQRQAALATAQAGISGQAQFANNTASPLSYAVLDGFEIPLPLVRLIDRPRAAIANGALD